MKKLFNLSISLSQWIIGFLGILFIRFLLENLSSRNSTGFLATDFSTLIHYYLFYLGLLLSLVLIARKFLPYTIKELMQIGLFSLMVTWLAPLFDLFLTSGQGTTMSYIFQGPLGLVRGFFTYFGPWMVPGITIGIRLEVLIVLIVLGYAVYQYRRNVKRTALALAAFYGLFFVWLSFPSLLKLLVDLVSGQLINSQPSQILYFFNNVLSSSIIYKNLFHPAIQFSSEIRHYQLLFNAVISQIYLFIDSLLLVVLFWNSHKAKLLAVLKNSRPERIFYYFSLVIIGGAMALNLNRYAIHWNWVDLLSVLTLLLSFYCAWMFSVGVNDLVDQEIDAVSNQGRPLVKGELSFTDMQQFNYIFLIWSFVSALIVGEYQLFFIIVFLFAYYIYSAPPLRLKQIPFVATFLISLASVSAVISGFFLLSNDKTIGSLPIELAILVILSITLVGNLKDLKDFEGDKLAGIKTLPVIYGIKKAKRIIGIFFIISYLLAPFLLSSLIILLPSLLAGIVTYFLIQQKSFKERSVFYVYFVYLIIILLVF
jgi:4-hydroxybenzoate polyprenyltransferase